MKERMDEVENRRIGAGKIRKSKNDGDRLKQKLVFISSLEG